MSRLGVVMAIAGTVLNLLMSITHAIDTGCDFYQDLEIGKIYYIYNKEYPNSYARSTSCRWTGKSPQGTQIAISCEDINIPTSADCNLDHISISLTGNANFNDGRNYCGKGGITLFTNANLMAIGLFSSNTSPGGRFLCSVTATQSVPSPPDPQPPSACDCGLKSGTRIVGGVETGVNEYPPMAGLVHSQTREVFCGSTIIAEFYAISAAHCLYKYQANIIGLLVGDHNIQAGNDSADAKLYPVSSYILHPNFNSDNFANDIGVIKTAVKIVFNIHVNPICLPFKFTNNDFDSASVTALGWGTTEFTGPQSDVLLKVNLNVVSTPDCKASLSDRVITDKQLCTFSPGKDTCQKDSGGPLVWLDPSIRRLQLVGIISYGLGCGSNKPGVNTRVSSYLSWIASVTPDAVYCMK